MNLTPHLKKGLNMFFRDWKMMIFSFLVLPMVLALVYGGMQKDLFDGRERTAEAVKVHFQYDENSEKGRVFKSILALDSIREFINLQEEAEYTVILDKQFSGAEIKGKDQGTTQFIMLNNFVQAVLNNFSNSEIIQSAISGLALSDSQEKSLVNNIQNSIRRNDEGGFIKERLVEGYKTLGSIEYFTISIFSFTSIIMVVTLASSFYKEIKQGTVKRAISTPNHRRDFFFGFVLNAFIISLVLSLVYVTINKVRGVAFLDNTPGLILTILLQSILASAVVGFIIAFVKKELTANLLMNFVLIVPSILGGAFFNGELIDSKIFKSIMNMAPNSLILNSYKGLAIAGDIGTISRELITMLVLAVIILIVSVIKIEKKWEV